jgi:hypothetical protein
VISDSANVDCVRERKIVCPKQSYSKSQTSSNESDDNYNTSNSGASRWVRKEKMSNL